MLASLLIFVEELKEYPFLIIENVILIQGKTPYPALPHKGRSIDRLFPFGGNEKGGKKNFKI
jgi:hypothetical protein